MDDATYYTALAAAYARGRLRLDASDDDALRAAAEAGLRLHRFKRNAGLPRVRRVLGMLRGLGPESLLDVGSGRGAFLWPMLDELHVPRVVAIDLLAHRARDLAAVGAGGVTALAAVRADVRALPFADGAFDGATALEVLEHMPDAERAARELVRAVRRFVVVSVPSDEDDNPEHVRLFDERSLDAMFRSAGARAVKCERVRGHVVAMVSR